MTNAVLPAARTTVPHAAYAALATAVICWGLLPLFQKELLAVFTPVEVTFARFFLSGVLLLLGVLLYQPGVLWSALRRHPLGILITSLIGPLLAMVAFNIGIQTVPIGVASLIVDFEPILTYVIAVGLCQERWNLPRMLSISLCVGGMVLIVVTDLGTGAADGVDLLVVCITPLVWALNTVISKPLVERVPPLVLITAHFLVSSACLAPSLGGDFLAKFPELSARLWAALAFSVVPGTVLAYAVWYWALRYLAPSTLSLSLNVTPVVAVIAGVVILGESLTVVKGIGIVTVLYGFYLVNVKYKENHSCSK